MSLTDFYHFGSLKKKRNEKRIFLLLASFFFFSIDNHFLNWSSLLQGWCGINMSSTFPGVSVELFNTQGFGRQFENPSFCQCMTTLNEWSVFRQWKSFSERVSTTRSVPFWTKITHMLLLCLSGQWISFACFFKQSFFAFCYFCLNIEKVGKSPWCEGRCVTMTESQVGVELVLVLDYPHWLNLLRTTLSLVSSSQVLYLLPSCGWDEIDSPWASVQILI